MTWTQSILDDEKHFPQKIGQFPLFYCGSSANHGRSKVPFNIHQYRQDNLTSVVQSIRSYLPPAL
jgi:hypothetical protein